MAAAGGPGSPRESDPCAGAATLPLPQEGQNGQDPPVVFIRGGQVQLAEDVGDVLLDRAGRDDQRAGDGGVGPALGHQAEDLLFSRGEGAERPVLPAGVLSPDQLGDDLAVERGPAPRDALDRADERLDVPHPLLEQVADPALPRVQQLRRVDGLHVLAEDEHAQPRVLLAGLERRADALVGERRRKPDVNDREVRLVPGEDPAQAVGVLRLRHDIDSLVLEQRDDALAQECLVLGDDYSHGSSACTVVPSPGLLTTTRMPSSASTRLRSPERPLPSGSAPPGPSSSISTTSRPLSSNSETLAAAP